MYMSVYNYVEMRYVLTIILNNSQLPKASLLTTPAPDEGWQYKWLLLLRKLPL